MANISQFFSGDREKQRKEANQKICDFVNSHRDHISASDVKNGQGLIATYALHKLMEQSPESSGFTLYEIADFIRLKKLWFKLSIKEDNGIFSVGNGSLGPYTKKIDGRKKPTMYIVDKVMRNGRSRISNFIMDTLKSNVISPNRQHTMIMRCVDRSVDGGVEKKFFLNLRPTTNFEMHINAFKMKGKMVPRGEWTSSQWRGIHYKFE